MIHSWIATINRQPSVVGKYFWKRMAKIIDQWTIYYDVKRFLQIPNQDCA